MAKEKKRLAVSPLLFTEDGTADGIITVSDTCEFRAKQIVFLKSDSENPQQFEVRTILSETQFTVGEKGTDFKCLSDVSAFTVSDNAEVYALEQLRPKISPDETLRYSYEEEPIVARRTVLVDQLGRVIKYDDGKLPITGDLNVAVSGKKTPIIRNLEITDKDTQETFQFPANVVEFEIRLRMRAILQYSYVDGGTALEFATLTAGGVYRETNLELDNPLNLYFETSKNNVTVEIKYWTK